MDRDTAARRVRHAAWESCGLLPLLLPAAIPSLMCVVPEWFFDSKDAMGIPAAFLCTAMCVGAWTMIAAVLGLRAARRGLAAAKHHPGLPGERACRFAQRGHVYLPLAAFLGPFIWFIVIANR